MNSKCLFKHVQNLGRDAKREDEAKKKKTRPLQKEKEKKKLRLQWVYKL